MTDRPGIQTIKDTAEEFGIPVEWAMKKKKRYIANRLGEIKAQVNEHKIMSRYCQHSYEAIFLERGLHRLGKEFNELQRYLHYLNNPPKNDDSITDEEIERARQYPIADLIPNYSGEKRIRCLFPEHEDTHASMQVNETYCYCHTCHDSLDAIGLLKLRGIDFVEAVKELAR